MLDTVRRGKNEVKVGAFLGTFGLGLIRPFFECGNVHALAGRQRGVVQYGRAGEERGSDRAGADGRTGRRALPWELRQGELVLLLKDRVFLEGSKFIT